MPMHLASAPLLPERPFLPSRKATGRGALGNPANRFESQMLEPFDDGWSTLESLAELPPLPTTLTRDSSKSAIAWNTSPDLGFDRAVNPYRGCEHGCIYCYARPSHAYLGYSPGLDFETRLVFKPDIASLLEKEFCKPGYEPKVLALGSNTDPYQPVDRTLKLTRSVLEVLERFGHPVSIVTKSAGVLRDIDILQRMAARGLVRVYLSVTTLDAGLARRMEPRAATPERRLAAIAALSQAGIEAAVLAAPMIPGLNDAELERILERASRAGARYAGYVLLRLPLEVRGMFEAWLAEHYPERARHVLSLIRETRAGQLNDARFHARFAGQGPYADLLAKRFARAARQWGFADRTPLATHHFAPPNRQSAAPAPQLSLF
jgi:DNA repair photolyase